MFKSLVKAILVYLFAWGTEDSWGKKPRGTKCRHSLNKKQWAGLQEKVDLEVCLLHFGTSKWNVQKEWSELALEEDRESSMEI